MNRLPAGQKSESISVDPITLEVIRHGIISICDQIDANMTRTAFSPYIYEYKDYAVGFVSAEGELLAQSTGGMPVFVADSVGMAVRDGLEVYGRDNLHKGDVIVCNHAAVQGQHLNNTVMYTPVFAGPKGDELIGFFAVNCHWIDIGGSAIGSVSYSSTDIFMEGLAAALDQDSGPRASPSKKSIGSSRTTRAFRWNCSAISKRSWAAACSAAILLKRWRDKYGPEVFLGALAVILDQCEAATREKIRAIPDGVYQHEAFLDNDGVRDEKIPIRVKVIVAGDELTVDFSEMSEQVKGCVNSGFYGGGRTCVRVAFKYLIATDEPANEGTFRPVKMILPEGKLISAEATAAMGLYSIPFPDRDRLHHQSVGAGAARARHRRPLRNFFFIELRRQAHRHRRIFQSQRQRPWRLGRLRHPRRRRPVSHHGPWRHAADSHRAARVHVSDSASKNSACARIPAARAVGAAVLGFDKQYVLLAPCELWANFDRIGCPPWGVQGAKAGKSGQVLIIKNGAAGSRAALQNRELPGASR